MAALEKSYWNGKGLHQHAIEQLTSLLPHSGPCKNPRSTNKHLEKFRRAQNCYYDVFNNGLFNRAAEFRRVFGFSGSLLFTNHNFNNKAIAAQWLESAIDDIIVAACKEQGIAIDDHAGHHYASLV